ncbi:hypothetical protein DH09_00750 (plasmid) [Bacillaceae bacterium JMAK1]|nr:hypothetical protein DH09_00750 [Bacillaceae bacterium JMAK1]
MNKEDAMSIIERLQKENKTNLAIDRMMLIAKEIQQEGFSEFITDVGFILKDPKKPFLWLCCQNESMVYFEDGFSLLHAKSLVIQVKRDQVKFYWFNGDRLFSEVDPFKAFVQMTRNSNLDQELRAYYQNR